MLKLPSRILLRQHNKWLLQRWKTRSLYQSHSRVIKEKVFRSLKQCWMPQGKTGVVLRVDPNQFKRRRKFSLSLWLGELAQAGVSAKLIKQLDPRLKE